MMFTNWEPLVRQWRARNALLAVLLSVSRKRSTFAGHFQQPTRSPRRHTSFREYFDHRGASPAAKEQK